MENGSWVVAKLPPGTFRLARFAADRPGSGLYFLHLGLDNVHGRAMHRFLLAARLETEAWLRLRHFFVHDLAATWTDLVPHDGVRDAMVAFTDVGRLGPQSRKLLHLWPHSRVSVLRFLDDGGADLYALPNRAEDADTLRRALHQNYPDARTLEHRDLSADERAWCSDVLTSPPLLEAMSRR